MRLTAGARVGAYDVVAPLGAGGMGEVFRARDARLKRDVALKVLPLAAVSDADRRARFEREAQVLAALDHPNIAIVFGVEDAGGAPAIVMELVEGPTLADRLAGGPLPVAEALGVAIELCHGLAAAHDSGIIHRDLKPANIKIRPDGVVKILDFGLALAPADASVDAANSPTMIGARTEAGTILGTAAYMSPEQARGRTVDARADVWAFGCVLYEMLTAQPAFAGESTTDILAAVVQSEPDWSALPAGVPARVEELLRRCLQKTLKERQRDIGDAGFELQRALADRAATPLPAAATHTALGPAAAPVAAAAAVRWAGPALALAVGAGLAAAWLGRSPAPAASGEPLRPTRLSITLPPQATLALGRGSAVAVSPDGTRVVYAARSGDRTILYRRDLDRFESDVLPGTEGATNPFFSPDGRWVGFFADRMLKKVSLDGGAPLRVADAPNPRGEAWGDGDTILVTPTNFEAIARVSAGDGALAPFTTLREGEASHRWPRFLPGNAGVLFSVWNDTGWEPASIEVQHLDGTTRTVVVERNGGYPRYVADGTTGRGFLVYAREDGLMAAPFDPATFKVTGTAVPMFDGLITNLSGGAHFDVSASGTLAYAPGAANEANRDLRWVTLDGTASPPIAMQHFSSREWRLSPDGTTVLYSNTTGGPTRNLWLKALDGDRLTQLTRGVDSYTGTWSPDGAWIVYLKGYPERLVRRAARPDGVDQELMVTPNFNARDVSPDGRWLLYQQNRAETGVDVLARRLPEEPPGASTSATLGEPQVVTATAANETSPQFSPDGRWVAYQSNTTGRFEVYVRAFPGGEQEFRVSTEGGLTPRWNPRGGELFYRSAGNAMHAVTLTVTPNGLTAGAPRRLFDATLYDSTYAVAPDGRRLLMMPVLTIEAAATEIRLVVNFLDELRARVK
jgi:eukaryotic-like serine/threonine-protein kinase